MEDCIFCQIVENKVPSSKVYESDDIVAFLTIEAINPGHTLVISKEHVEEFQELDKSSYRNLMDTVQKIARAQKEIYQPKRVGLLVQGFEVAHAHIHVVPLFHPTDVTSKKLLDKTALRPSAEEMKIEAEKIRRNLS